MLLNLLLYLAFLALFLRFFLNRTNRLYATGIAVSVTLTFAWLWIIICFQEPHGDPYRYMLTFKAVRELGLMEALQDGHIPPGFLILNWTVGQVSDRSWVFFSAIYALAVSSLFYAMRLFLGPIHGTIALMLYSMYPFYLNYLAAGFKQGIATGLLLVGIANLLRQKKTAFLWLLASTLFHASTWLCVVVLVGWSAVPRLTARKLVPFIVATSFVLGATGLSQPIVETFLPTSILDALGFSSYFDLEYQDSDDFLSVGLLPGFRWDFALFTCLPLIVWYAYRKKLEPVTDLVVVYSLFASLYFLLAFVPYANRIASFAWVLIPVMLYAHSLCAFDTGRGQRVVVATLAAYPPLMLTYMASLFL